MSQGSFGAFAHGDVAHDRLYGRPTLERDRHSGRFDLDQLAIQAFEQELRGRVAFTALESVPAPFEHSLLRVGVDELDDRSTDEVVWPLDAGHVQRCLI